MTNISGGSNSNNEAEGLNGVTGYVDGDIAYSGNTDFDLTIANRTAATAYYGKGNLDSAEADFAEARRLYAVE